MRKQYGRPPSQRTVSSEHSRMISVLSTYLHRLVNQQDMEKTVPGRMTSGEAVTIGAVSKIPAQINGGMREGKMIYVIFSTIKTFFN